MRLLLLEDDPSLGETIKSWLELDGYVVDWLKSGADAEPAVRAHNYACILLDRGLPHVEGDKILKMVRNAGSAIPVLILSARNEVADRIAGLDLGADDYLPKPFDLNELSARIRAALRRRSTMTTPTLSHGALNLDPGSKLCTLSGRQIGLTAKEFIVLTLLMQRPGAVMESFLRMRLANSLVFS